MEPPLLGICLSLVLIYTMAYNITGKKGGDLRLEITRGKDEATASCWYCRLYRCCGRWRRWDA